MKIYFLIISFILVSLTSHTVYSFDDSITFQNEHKFNISEIFKYDGCKDFYGELKSCFDVYNTKGEEIAGWCINSDILNCNKFVKGKKYKITYASEVNRDDMDFDYDGIEILNIEEIK